MKTNVYFSKVLDPNSWDNNDCQFMTLFLIPNKWWSIKAWKLANSVRAEMLKAFMLKWKPNIILTQVVEEGK